MKFTKPATIAITALLVGALSACGGTKTTSKTQPSVEYLGTNETVEEAPAPVAPETAATPSEQQGDPNQGPKPSRDEVTAGIYKNLIDLQAPESNARKLAECLVEHTYDKLTAQSLQNLSQGKPVIPSDQEISRKAGTNCTHFFPKPKP